METDWDWQLSVEVYGRKLQGILVGLFVLVGVSAGRIPETISRQVRLAALEILRPAEAALRRVIVMAMRGMEPVGDGVRRVREKRPAPRKPGPRGKTSRGAGFALFDARIRLADLLRPRTRKRGPGPRMTVIGVDRYVAYTPPSPPLPDDELDAGALMRRLRAMQTALDDIDGQARRMARLIARRKARPGRGIVRPIRYARPPGHRARGKRPVDEILADCQELALIAMNEMEAGPA